MARLSTVKEKKNNAEKSNSSKTIKLKLTHALRKRFPADTVDITDGYAGDIHVLVVSRTFEKMTERTRYAYLWKIVQDAGLNEEERDLVTVVVGVSPSELI